VDQATPLQYYYYLLLLLLLLLDNLVKEQQQRQTIRTVEIRSSKLRHGTNLAPGIDLLPLVSLKQYRRLDPLASRTSRCAYSQCSTSGSPYIGYELYMTCSSRVNHTGCLQLNPRRRRTRQYWDPREVNKHYLRSVQLARNTEERQLRLP